MRTQTANAARQAREAHGLILSRALTDTDVLDDLRIERRHMLQNERELKAMADVEKKNMRAAKVLSDRKKDLNFKQQQMLRSALASFG